MRSVYYIQEVIMEKNEIECCQEKHIHKNVIDFVNEHLPDEEILYDFSDELGISKIETEAFVRKMESNGRLRYALNVLKSVENNRMFGLIYPNLYSIVATLESTNGLNKLNQIYKDEFGHTDEDINMTWKLYEIKDFRKNCHNNTSSHSSATPRSSSGTGCLLLLLAIPASLFMFFCGVTLLFNI